MSDRVVRLHLLIEPLLLLLGSPNAASRARYILVELMEEDGGGGGRGGGGGTFRKDEFVGPEPFFVATGTRSAEAPAGSVQLQRLSPLELEEAEAAAEDSIAARGHQSPLPPQALNSPVAPGRPAPPGLTFSSQGAAAPLAKLQVPPSLDASAAVAAPTLATNMGRVVMPQPSATNMGTVVMPQQAMPRPLSLAGPGAYPGGNGPVVHPPGIAGISNLPVQQPGLSAFEAVYDYTLPEGSQQNRKPQSREEEGAVGIEVAKVRPGMKTRAGTKVGLRALVANSGRQRADVDIGELLDQMQRETKRRERKKKRRRRRKKKKRPFAFPEQQGTPPQHFMPFPQQQQQQHLHQQQHLQPQQQPQQPQQQLYSPHPLQSPYPPIQPYPLRSAAPLRTGAFAKRKPEPAGSVPGLVGSSPSAVTASAAVASGPVGGRGPENCRKVQHDGKVFLRCKVHHRKAQEINSMMQAFRHLEKEKELLQATMLSEAIHDADGNGSDNSNSNSKDNNPTEVATKGLDISSVDSTDRSEEEEEDEEEDEEEKGSDEGGDDDAAGLVDGGAGLVDGGAGGTGGATLLLPSAQVGLNVPPAEERAPGAASEKTGVKGARRRKRMMIDRDTISIGKKKKKKGSGSKRGRWVMKKGKGRVGSPKQRQQLLQLSQLSELSRQLLLQMRRRRLEGRRRKSLQKKREQRRIRHQFLPGAVAKASEDLASGPQQQQKQHPGQIAPQQQQQQQQSDKGDVKRKKPKTSSSPELVELETEIISG